MLFGWDTGLIGGILPRASFKRSFGLDVDAAAYADLSGWIVSVLQAGCFFGAMSTAWVSESEYSPSSHIGAVLTFGRSIRISSGDVRSCHSLNEARVPRFPSQYSGTR